MQLKSIILTALLLTGVAGSLSAQRDITSQYIVNAKLVPGTNGWTDWTVQNFNTPEQGNNTVGYATEAYAGWDNLKVETFSLTQNITLPAGSYRLVNYSFFRQGEAFNTNATKSLGYLKAGSSQVALQTLGSISADSYANDQKEGANCFDAKMYRNVVEFELTTQTTLEIGVVGTFDEMRSWCIVGLFELFDMNDVASISSPTDVTYAITNSGFEYRNGTGWTSNGGGGYANNNNYSSKAGIGFVERWQSTSSGGLSNGTYTQQLTNMPNGLYELSVYAHNIEQYNNSAGGSGMYLKANDDRTEISTNKQYKVRTTVTDGNLTVGIQLDECTGNWIAFDRFGLLFYGDPLQAYKDMLAEKVAAAQALVDGNTLRTGAADALQAVIDANDNDDDAFTEESQFNTAISNIEAAMATANSVAEAYPAYDAFRAKVAALEDGVPNGQSKTQFDNALAAADAAVDAATSDAAVNEQIPALRSAAMTFISTTDGSFDITFLASQQYTDWKLKNGSPAGIVADQFLTGRPSTIPSFAESYETTCATTGTVLYQTVSDLPEGYYQVEMYAQALFTPGRDFTSEATEGDANRSFAFAGNQRTGLPIKFGTSVAFADLTTLNVNVHLTSSVNDLTFGVTKDANGSNWHFAQIASIVYSNAPDLTNLQATRDALVAEATGLLGSSDASLLTAEQQQTLQNAIDAANAANTFETLNEATLTTLPNAIANARQQIVAAKESRVSLIAALERFERDYNLTDGTNYGRVTMSAEAWTTLLAKVNDVTEALDDISLVSEFATRAQALEDQMDATDASIKLFSGYLSLLNGVNSFNDNDLGTAYDTYGTDTQYTADDDLVQAAITALDAAFQGYAARQTSNFEAGGFLGENLDFETANGAAIDATWPSVYQQVGWKTTFISEATEKNKQYAYLTQDNATPRDGGTNYVRLRQNWASSANPRLQIEKNAMLPTGTYELKFFISSENSGANMTTDLNYYQLGDATAVSLKPTNTDWTERTYQLEVTEPTFFDLSFGFITANDNSPASVWVDDITLTYIAVSEFQVALDEARTVNHAATNSAIAEYEDYEGHEDNFTTEEARQEAIQVLRNAKTIADSNGDATSLVSNADMTGSTTSKPMQGSGGNVLIPSGWEFDYSYEGWNDTNVNNGVFNAWAGTINKAELMQTIHYLPKGIYRLTAQAGTDVTDGSSTVAIYINPNDYDHVGRSQEVITLNNPDNRDFGDYSCAAEVSDVSNHQLTLGIYSSRCYYQVKNFTLTYLGMTEEAQVEAASSYLRQDYFWQRNQLEWTATDEKYALADNVVVYPQQKNQLITTTSLDWWADKTNKIVNGVCNELVLTDGQGMHSGYGFHASTAFTATSVTHDRVFAAGTKLTVCLPFVPTNYNGQFYVLSNATGETLKFESVETPEAYTPYIFIAGDGGSTLGTSNASIGKTPDEMVGNTVNDHFMVGVLDNTQVTNIYGFTKTGQLAFAETSSMNPFRSYIQAPSLTSRYNKAFFANMAPVNPNSILGDANGDKNVSISDITMMVDYILDNPCGYFIYSNADVNKDESISVSDITSVVNIILNEDAKPSNISSSDNSQPYVAAPELKDDTTSASSKVNKGETKILK